MLPDAVGENATVVLLELIDAGENGVALKIVKHRPNFALLETGRLIGQHVFGDVGKELVEDIVERHKINQLGRIFVVDGRQIFEDGLGDILQSTPIVPNQIESLQKLIDIGRAHARDEIDNIIAALAAERDAGEALQTVIDELAGGRLDDGEVINALVGDNGFEGGASTEPGDAISSDGALRHFVSQFELELGTVQAPLPIEFRYEKFAPAFIVRFLDEGRRGENESEILDGVELLFEGVVSVDGKLRGGDVNLTASANNFFHVVANDIHNVVKNNRIHLLISSAVGAHRPRAY